MPTVSCSTCVLSLVHWCTFDNEMELFQGASIGALIAEVYTRRLEL